MAGVWATAGCAFLVACLTTNRDASSDCVTGREGCACYGNSTCDNGLACRSKLCVDLEASGAEPNSEHDAASPDGDDDSPDPSSDEPIADRDEDAAPDPDEPTTDEAATDDTATDEAPAPEGPASDDSTPSPPPDDTPTEDPTPPAPSDPGYQDVILIASCDGPRGETFDGAWFSVAGESSSIAPADSSGSFPMVADGYDGMGARVTGTVATGDYASLGHVMYRGSDLFDASAYAGISFYAKSSAPLTVSVALAQENNDPAYGICEDDVSCYNYPNKDINVGPDWTRFVVLFAELEANPDLPALPVTPSRIKHWQFGMPAGTFDFWVDELYLVAKP